MLRSRGNLDRSGHRLFSGGPPGGGRAVHHPHPTWNNLPYLRLCVESILRSSTFAHQVVGHVSDGSDGTLDWVRQAGFENTWSRQDAGVSLRLNTAAGASRVYHSGRRTTSRVGGDEGRRLFARKLGLPASRCYRRVLRIGAPFAGPLPEMETVTDLRGARLEALSHRFPKR